MNWMQNAAVYQFTLVVGHALGNPRRKPIENFVNALFTITYGDPVGDRQKARQGLYFQQICVRRETPANWWKTGDGGVASCRA
jgi:hypothetical protein